METEPTAQATQQRGSKDNMGQLGKEHTFKGVPQQEKEDPVQHRTTDPVDAMPPKEHLVEAQKTPKSGIQGHGANVGAVARLIMEKQDETDVRKSRVKSWRRQGQKKHRNGESSQVTPQKRILEEHNEDLPQKEEEQMTQKKARILVFPNETAMMIDGKQTQMDGDVADSALEQDRRAQ
ncbi:unnamed protein product [Linum trigynum]|uniref:Uncharacterized protein n=1 Tax=Linum trigynum TaxID=586398 RepID=A0AAV2DSU8_9ROSI